MINIAFVGNPNVGKTALINKISNASLKMGNWPGVTIEKKEVFFKVGNEDVKLIDLPGIYNLSIGTPEERISRNFILEEDVDVIINVVDSTSLERNLYLTALLKEMGKPMVMALNFEDEFKKLDYKLNLETLEKQLGMKAIFTSGRNGAGIDELMKEAVEAFKRNQTQKQISYKLSFDNDIEKEIDSVKEKLSKLENKEILKKYSLDWLAIKSLENDMNLFANLKTKYGVDISDLAKEERENLKKRYGIDSADVISQARYATVKGIASMNLKRSSKNKFALTNSVVELYFYV